MALDARPEMRAYFDYNASAIPLAEVREVVARVLADAPGNPSSGHVEGRRARRLIEEAREQVAGVLGIDLRRIVFTSGATEANNTALRGFVRRMPKGGIVTTTIEHHSVLATADALEQSGTRVARIDVDADARPDLQRIARVTREMPCLLSVAAANGETGHCVDLDTVREAAAPGTLIHVDAAQALGRIDLAVVPDIDLMSISAHKLGGPQGVGALVVPKDATWPSLLTGGPQERGRRAGSESVAAIVGFGVAVVSVARRMNAEASRLRLLREELWERLSSALPSLARITPRDGLPNTLTIASGEVSGDVLVAGLDLAGYAVSAGSACAAGAPEPSHVLRALGVEPPYLEGAVRISMGHATTAGEVTGLATAFVEVVSRAREAA